MTSSDPPHEDEGAEEQAGIRLPARFEATVFHDGVGYARHVAVRENGDVYVALREPNQGGGVAALPDAGGGALVSQAAPEIVVNGF